MLNREECWTDTTNGSGGHKSQRPGWEWEEKGNEGGAVQQGTPELPTFPQRPEESAREVTS